jgi:hypothetical protein
VYKALFFNLGIAEKKEAVNVGIGFNDAYVNVKENSFAGTILIRNDDSKRRLVMNPEENRSDLEIAVSLQSKIAAPPVQNVHVPPINFSPPATEILRETSPQGRYVKVSKQSKCCLIIEAYHP